MKTTAIFSDQIHAADAIAAFRAKGVGDDRLSILGRDTTGSSAMTGSAGATDLGTRASPAIGIGHGLDEGTRDITTGGGTPASAIGDPGVGPGIEGDADRFIDNDGDQELTEQGQRHVARGLIGGGALGGLVGVALFAIPGIGPIAAAGTLAAMLTGGITAGAGLGGLREILTRHGHDDDEATMIADRIDQGHVMVSIDTDGSGIDRNTAIEIIEDNGGTIASRQAATV